MFAARSWCRGWRGSGASGLRENVHALVVAMTFTCFLVCKRAVIERERQNFAAQATLEGYLILLRREVPAGSAIGPA